MISVDSSSLILMAKIGILDRVIKNTKEKLVITREVNNESTANKETFDAKIIEKKIEEKSIGKKEIKNSKSSKKIQNDFNLGKGEAEAIAFCIENNASLLTDDKKAMNACNILGIKFTTVPNLLIQLHNKKLITKIEFDLHLKKLIKFGRYSDSIIQKVKEEAQNEKNG